MLNRTSLNENWLATLAFLLTKLASIVPVTARNVETTVSAMNSIKTRMHNEMEDEWASDALITYVKNDVFDVISKRPLLTAL